MKNFLLILLSVFMIAACSKESEDSKIIKLTGGTSASQSLYADQQQRTITFTATQPWSIQVDDLTPRSTGDNTSWLTLNRYSGQPGDVTLNASLLVNDTGSSRKAKISIECGGVTLVVTIEQQATTQSGDKPTLKAMVDKILISKNNSIEEEWQFTYSGSTVTKIAIDRSRATSGYTESYTFTRETNNQLRVIRERVSTQSRYASFLFDLNNKGYVVSGESIEDGIAGNYTYQADERLVGFVFSVLEWRYEWLNGNISTVSEYIAGNKEGSFIYPIYSTPNDRVNIDLNMLYVDLKSITSNESGIRFLDPNMLSMVGYLGVRSKNLVKAGIKSRFNTELHYEFIQEGVPSKITNQKGADTYTVAITYR